MAEESCIFCRIAEKKASASIVYEDNVAMAFLDIHPLNEGHTLVIPKRHYAFIYEVPEEEVAHLYKLVKKVALAVKKSVKPGGITIAQQNERAAGQDIFHVHVHVIPRYEGQKLPRFEEVQEVGRARLDEVAKKLKQHI
ncbi:HIT family protein [Candidatus Bathyarchaeota archaeon]|nr:HIT family protein [Candidatus Bathyarchaeota archaeon]